jgi:hypothetical protein
MSSLHEHTQMSKLFKGMGSGLTGGMKAQQRLLSQIQANKDSEDRLRYSQPFLVSLPHLWYKNRK